VVTSCWEVTSLITLLVRRICALTVFQPPTRLAVQGQLGPFRATASYLLEPVANDVELESRSALLRPIGPLAVPRVKAAVAHNLGTLKELLESTRPAAQVTP
jgi:hypothetical protein